MANMTLSIPDDLIKEMRFHSDIKWSEVARQAIDRKLKQLHVVDQILSRSRLTEDDAEEIGHKIKHEISKRFVK